MSTIKVNSIKNTSTSDGGISIDGSGHVTIDGQKLPSAGPLSNRNLIINGAMQVAQRSTSETGQETVDGYVSVDRWKVQTSSSGTFTISQSTEAPDGFANSFKFDCTTADATPGYLLFFQVLEGQNLQHIQKGKSGAQQLTLSFYVRSSKTGTYQANLRDIDNNRLVGSSYTINTANTWEYKTITFAADTTGQFGNDNNASLQIEWWLASGSTYSGGTVPTAWETRDNTDRAAALNVAIGASTDDDFYITGVQLEVGSVATPFEHRSYGDELAKCQRYFQRFDNGSTIAVGVVGSSTSAFFDLKFIQTMRAAPSLTVNTLGSIVKEGVNWYPNTGITASTDENQATLVTTQSNNTMGSTNATRLGNGTDISFSAEL